MRKNTGKGNQSELLVALKTLSLYIAPTTSYAMTAIPPVFEAAD